MMGMLEQILETKAIMDLVRKMPENLESFMELHRKETKKEVKKDSIRISIDFMIASALAELLHKLIRLEDKTLLKMNAEVDVKTVRIKANELLKEITIFYDKELNK